MKCPKCESTQLRKNGRSSGKQRYLCKVCGRQFLQPLSSSQLPSVESEAIQVASNGNVEPRLAEAALPMLSVPEVSELQLDQAATPTQSAQGIGILLLDAENLRLDINSEKFLAELSHYPLQVKIAFANWRNHAVGKLDAELYERGYQLIHVPGGQNSADAQMIAMGVSISRHYPDAKEVFVCSSDWLLTHLCNSLQSQGMTVYRVRRQENNLSVENRNTGDSRQYSLTLGRAIPSFEEFVEKIDELLKAEHESINERIARFSTVANLFQERCNLTLNATRSNASLMVEEEQDSITPVLADESTQIITVHEDVESKTVVEIIPASEVTIINSMETLEKVLREMIKTRTVEAGLDYISVTKFKTDFKAQYNKTADEIVKRFQPSSSLIKFLRSRPTVFKLILDGNEYQVAIASA
jgi:hypothetical protein